ncbi:MAG: hypothetical protein RIS88_221 [Pseudomonadota bacterium]|jgi:hypothetical protein
MMANPAARLAGAAHSRPLAAKSHTRHPDRRPYISQRVLDILRPTPLGAAAISSFRFQSFASCLENSDQMTQTVTQRLVTQGLLAREHSGPASSLVPIPARAPGANLDLERVQRTQALHGPLQLETRHTLAPGQGGDLYDHFHAAVLLATFEREGRTIGLLLDGNDRQLNPAVMAFAHWALATRGMRLPSQFETADFQAYNAQRRRDTLAQPDLYQAAFRLVDLGEMLSVSQRDPHAKQVLPLSDGSVLEWPMRQTVLRADTGVRVVRPLLPPETGQALRDALGDEPRAVERFPISD